MCLRIKFGLYIKMSNTVALKLPFDIYKFCNFGMFELGLDNTGKGLKK